MLCSGLKSCNSHVGTNPLIMKMGNRGSWEVGLLLVITTVQGRTVTKTYSSQFSPGTCPNIGCPLLSYQRPGVWQSMVGPRLCICQCPGRSGRVPHRRVMSPVHTAALQRTGLPSSSPGSVSITHRLATDPWDPLRRGGTVGLIGQTQRLLERDCVTSYFPLEFSGA